MFSNKRQKRSGYRRGGGEKLGRVKRGETVIRLYYVRKKNIFKQRGKMEKGKEGGKNRGTEAGRPTCISYEKYIYILASTGSEK